MASSERGEVYRADAAFGCCRAGQRFWAGTAVAAAGCGDAGGADLFASALRMLAAIISMLDPMTPNKNLLLLLLGAGSRW